MMKKKTTVCDLCHQHPSLLYCCSDSAFLCPYCDSKVHSANFLVARHLRLTLCSNCTAFTEDSASSTPLIPSLCTSCSPTSSSSACISSTTPPKATTISDSSSEVVTSKAQGIDNNNNNNIIDWKTKGMLVNWCVELGFISNRDRDRDRDSINVVIEVASRAFEVMNIRSRGRVKGFLPYRVGLAASLWFSLLRFTEEEDKKNKNKKKKKTCRQQLNMVEEITGVPAKLIAVAASNLSRSHSHSHSHSRIINLQRKSNPNPNPNPNPKMVVQLEEGWAEC